MSIFSNLRKMPILFNPTSILIAFTLPTIALVSLPGEVIDVFILMSFISAALLLIIMLENDEPLKVTFLPTVVLLLTTFRLLLSIATTRNIIANEEVGSVIQIIGEFVMGGNLISGLLIFVIITIVQFLVVTKGGERVAEVGARFSLDAMPGRQMSIDGDLKSNLITGEQAQKMRADLSTENKLFGSLDGAMKFIKGDSIAGILISLVNLFGGIYVGINEFELSLGESVSRFSVLTIGDGLVSQIPSLLLSLACGVYLTRIKSDAEDSTSLSKQVMSQIQHYWKSLIVVAVVILLMGILNPQMLFVALFLTVVLGATAVVLKMREDRGDGSFDATNDESSGSGLFEALKFVVRNRQSKEIISGVVDDIAKSVWNQEIGMPAVKVDHESPKDIEVYITGVKVYSFDQSEAQEYFEIMNDDFHLFSDDLNVNLKNIAGYIARVHFNEKYNLQYTNDIVEALSSQSEIMKNEVDSAIGLNKVHDVIKDMIRFPEFYLDRISFFEALIHWSRVESESKNWLVRIRPQAKYEITSTLLGDHEQIVVALFPPEVMEVIESYVLGQNPDMDALIEMQSRIKDDLVKMMLKHKQKPVIIVNDNELVTVKDFMRHISSTVPVCSHNDISDPELVSETETLEVM